MKNVRAKIKRGFVIALTASMVISCCFQSVFAEELVTLSDNSKKAVEPSASDDTSQGEFNASVPEESTTSSTGKWLLYGGLTAAGVGILAVAIGSSGGDDSSSSFVESDVTPVGPSIAGNDWFGTLSIADKSNVGGQAVTGVVTQEGDIVTITTSSTLAYGQHFIGKISSNGYLKVLDTGTNQTWTTHRGNASTHSIDLYDYVNNYSTYDTLFLNR